MCQRSHRKSDEIARQMVSHWLKAYRVKNLAIVAIVQAVYYYLIFVPLVKDTRMTLMESILLILCTVLITLGGYLINDYFDYETDHAWKKSWHTISKKSIKLHYKIVVILGSMIALFIAYRLSLLIYFPIYIFATIMLYYYSSRLKCIPWAGNIIVSVFCVGTILIYFLAEPVFESLIVRRLGEGQKLYDYTVFLCCFAFFLTMARELAKDIEDVEGDQSVNCQTIAVKFGVRTSIFVTKLMIVNLLLTLFWWWTTPYPMSAMVYSSIFSVSFLSLCIYILWIWQAHNALVLSHSVSNILKFAMVLGILYLVLIVSN